MLIGSITNNTNVNTLTIGDSLSFTVHDPSYPASEWDLQLAFNLQGSKMATVDATASGDNHEIVITSAASALFKTGRCQAWLIYTNKADNTLRKSSYVGVITILPDPSGNLTPSPTKLALDAVNAAIQQMIAAPALSVSFNGQSYSLNNPRDIYDIRDRLQRTLDAEYAEIGIATRSGHRTIRSRFI